MPCTGRCGDILRNQVEDWGLLKALKGGRDVKLFEFWEGGWQQRGGWAEGKTLQRAFCWSRQEITRVSAEAPWMKTSYPLRNSVQLKMAEAEEAKEESCWEVRQCLDHEGSWGPYYRGSVVFHKTTGSHEEILSHSWVERWGYTNISILYSSPRQSWSQGN